MIFACLDKGIDPRSGLLHMSGGRLFQSLDVLGKINACVVNSEKRNGESTSYRRFDVRRERNVDHSMLDFAQHYKR